MSHWLQEKMFKILIKSQSPAEELDHLAFKTRQFSAAVKAALKTKYKQTLHQPTAILERFCLLRFISAGSQRALDPRESCIFCACQHVRKSKMALTFYSLLEACLLMVNAVAVLHEERFLAKGICRYYLIQVLVSISVYLSFINHEIIKLNPPFCPRNGNLLCSCSKLPLKHR